MKTPLQLHSTASDLHDLIYQIASQHNVDRAENVEILRKLLKQE